MLESGLAGGGGGGGGPEGGGGGMAASAFEAIVLVALAEADSAFWNLDKYWLLKAIFTADILLAPPVPLPEEESFEVKKSELSWRG